MDCVAAFARTRSFPHSGDCGYGLHDFPGPRRERFAKMIPRIVSKKNAAIGKTG
jgi:hypothetical protein